MAQAKVLLIGAYLGGYVHSRLKGRPLEIIEPIFNRKILLRKMARFLVGRGHDVTISPLPISTRHINETVLAHVEFLEKSEGSWNIVGWSTGGIVGYGCLVSCENKVKSVIGLSPPILGSTNEGLNRDVSRLGLSPSLYHGWRGKILEHSERITVIGSRGDSVAPPSRCWILGVNGTPSKAHHILTEETASLSVGHSSFGSHPAVFEIIDQCLQKRVSAH